MIHLHATNDHGQTAIPARVFIVLLLILAAVLRFYHLDSQLWLDEVSALRGYRKPFIETITTFPGFFPNPLYELLAHASLLIFGESSWSIRLPAALFGIAGVIVFYQLAARRCIGPGNAALAAALLTVSYHHVFYSQDARGYTTYLFFALLSTSLLLNLIERVKWKTATAYVLSTALTAYAHPFGIFLLAGHMLVAFPYAFVRGSRSRSDDATPWQIFAIGALTALVILAMFAPLIQDAINYALTEAREPGHGRQVTGIGPELIEGLKAGFGGWPGIIAGTVVGCAGLSDMVRRQPFALGLLTMPIVLSIVAMIVLGAGVHPRYFLLALPVGYLVATNGIMVVVRFLAHLIPSGDSRKTVAMVQTGFAVVVFLIACFPLRHYYVYPKQDFEGALQEIHERAGPEDRIVAASHAGGAMQLFYAPDLPTADDLEDLLAFEAEGRRMWVMTTLEREMHSHRPQMLRHLQEEYERVSYLPGTLGDGAMRIYVKEPENPARPGQGQARQPGDEG